MQMISGGDADDDANIFHAIVRDDVGPVCDGGSMMALTWVAHRVMCVVVSEQGILFYLDLKGRGRERERERDRVVSTTMQSNGCLWPSCVRSAAQLGLLLGSPLALFHTLKTRHCPASKKWLAVYHS